MKKICIGFVLLFAMVLPAFAQQAMPLDRIVGIPFRTGNTAIGTASLTPGQMSGLLTGTPTAAATYTTPTATQLCQLFPFVGGSATNFHWDFWVKNTSAGANTITLAGGTGVTLVGTGTAAQSAVRHFVVVLNNCVAGSQAAQLISLDTSAF